MSAGVLVLSDTHIRDGGRRRLPLAVRRAAARADLIIHAGDLLDAGVLADLGDYAPVHAVLGNNDHDLVGELPTQLMLELGGVSVGVVHDSGPCAGRARRLNRMFPEAAVVIFGHSHLPSCAAGLASQWLFNPGSCTERRRAPTHSYGWLRVHDDAKTTLELRDVSD